MWVHLTKYNFYHSNIPYNDKGFADQSFLINWNKKFDPDIDCRILGKTFQKTIFRLSINPSWLLWVCSPNFSNKRGKLCSKKEGSSTNKTCNFYLFCNQHFSVTVQCTYLFVIMQYGTTLFSIWCILCIISILKCTLFKWWRHLLSYSLHNIMCPWSF